VNSRVTRKPRLLIISPWERLWSLGGGAGVSDDFQFVRGFAAAGWDIHFLRPDSGESLGSDSTTIHTYPNFFRQTRGLPVALRRLLWLPLFNMIAMPRAMQVAKDIRPDFVLGHSHYSARTTWQIRRRLGIKAGIKLFGVMDLVHTEWSRAKYTFKNMEQLIGLRYPQDAWIVLDDGTRGGQILRDRGIPEARIHFLPNGLNLEWQSESRDRTTARKTLGLPVDGPVVLFLARLVASKRAQDVLRAAPDVLRNHPETTFLFAGDGDQRGSCESLARSLELGEHARFLGTIEHGRVPELMAASDVFVTTSSLTNMALPTCEALICGLPVVAYDVGDTARVVHHDETGLLAPDGDVAALAAAIGDLIADPVRRSTMGDQAMKLARGLFTSWPDRIQMEIDIIERLVDVGPHDPTMDTKETRR